ncbi:MAG: GNAT family N-acetyltransferase [Anaeroplasmataceae bacterium]
MITTQNLKIKKTTLDDIDNYYSISSDSNIMYFWPLEYNTNKNELVNSLSDNKKVLFSVYLKNNNEYVGQVNYDIISTLNEYKLCDLKFFFKKNEYIVEALNAILEFMILHDYCIKVITNLLTLNEVSIKALLKCGFVLDKKQEALFDNKNTFIDTYKITKPIFIKKQGGK